MGGKQWVFKMHRKRDIRSMDDEFAHGSVLEAKDYYYRKYFEVLDNMISKLKS